MKDKRKPPKWVVGYYNLLGATKKQSLKGVFPPTKTDRYKPIIAAVNGSLAAFNFAQEELRKLFDLPDYEN